MTAASAIRPQFGNSVPAFHPARAPVLFSTDLDETLVAWRRGENPAFEELKLQRTIDSVRAHRPQMAVHVNTGRGLSFFKMAAERIAPYLKQMPIDFLSLNNGLELYINRHQEPADQWIAKLTVTDQDPGWALYVQRRTRWDAAVIHAARERVLQAFGFVPVTDNPDLFNQGYIGLTTYRRTLRDRVIIVQTMAAQPGFKVFELLTDGQGRPIGKRWDADLHQEARLWIGALSEALTEQGIPNVVHCNDENRDSRGTFGIYTVFPKGIHKGRAVQHVLRKCMTQPKAVITAGDHHFNDTDALKPRGYRGPGRFSYVPNYPILSGDNSVLKRQLGSRRRLDQTDMGNLGPAIDRQMGRITRERLNRLA